MMMMMIIVTSISTLRPQISVEAADPSKFFHYFVPI